VNATDDDDDEEVQKKESKEQSSDEDEKVEKGSVRPRKKAVMANSSGTKFTKLYCNLYYWAVYTHVIHGFGLRFRRGRGGRSKNNS
jgi:hypothetical protein